MPKFLDSHPLKGTNPEALKKFQNGVTLIIPVGNSITVFSGSVILIESGGAIIIIFSSFPKNNFKFL